MLYSEIIRKKRDGQVLTAEELEGFLRDYLAGTVADYQMAAFLMAVYFKGMMPSERLVLTGVLQKSGAAFPRPQREEFRKNDFWIDKHSTGGVGDKTSLLLVPLVSAVCRRLLGPGKVCVPMVSGRGLGHTGGTLDKMASVPGFRFQLSVPEAMGLLKSQGFFMMGQTEEFAPLDKRLYALRDVTATVESVPLIVSSILSKKLAESLDGLVLDVKAGNGALFESEAEAKALAVALVETAKAQGVETIALLTSMDEPLGWTIGNQVEVEESADFLLGKDREPGLEEVTLSLAAWMVHLASHRKLTFEQAHRECLLELGNKDAYGLFLQMFSAQGGSWERFLGRPAGVQTVVVAEKSGFVEKIEARSLGLLVQRWGGGRATIDSVIDPWVGVRLRKKVGDRVALGDELAVLRYPQGLALHEVRESFRETFKVGQVPVAKTKWVRGVIQ